MLGILTELSMCVNLNCVFLRKRGMVVLLKIDFFKIITVLNYIPPFFFNHKVSEKHSSSFSWMSLNKVVKQIEIPNSSLPSETAFQLYPRDLFKCIRAPFTVEKRKKWECKKSYKQSKNVGKVSSRATK